MAVGFRAVDVGHCVQEGFDRPHTHEDDQCKEDALEQNETIRHRAVDTERNKCERNQPQEAMEHLCLHQRIVPLVGGLRGYLVDDLQKVVAQHPIDQIRT